MNWLKHGVRERAEVYADLLAEGSEILDDTDGETVADFIHLLPGLLFARKRLYLQRCADRYVVVTTPPWLLRRLRGDDDGTVAARYAFAQALRATARGDRVICRKCGRPAFDCEDRLTLVVSAITEPFLPILGVRRRAAA